MYKTFRSRLRRVTTAFFVLSVLCGAVIACGGEKAADKDALGTAITNAEALLASVEESSDGAGLLPGDTWAASADRGAFNTAITNAKAVFGDDGATQDQVNAAVTALAGAQTTFNSKITTVPGGNEIPSGGLYPAPGAVNAYTDGALIITFDDVPTLTDGGYISIYEAGVASPVDTIRIFTRTTIADADTDKGETLTYGSTPLNVAGQLTRVDGNSLYITPHFEKLEYGKQYYVTIPAAAITGTFRGSAFTGFSGSTAWSFTTRAAAPALSASTPITVNGSLTGAADFRTVNGALAYISGQTGSWTINVAPGTYYEMIHYSGNQSSITINGTGTAQYGADVVLQYLNHNALNAGTHNRGAYYFTGPANIVLKNITFRNLDNRAGGQAEVIHFANADGKTRVVYNCAFYGHQDTLLTGGKCWFYKCYIEGDTDFIWGGAEVNLFEDCEIVSILQPGSASNTVPIIAPRVGALTNPQIPKGYVIFKSTIRSATGVTTQFARSQGYVSQAAVINTALSGAISPSFWSTSGDYAHLDNGEHVGYKVYGLTSGGVPVDTSGKAAGTSVMEDWLYNQEYNGRHTIFNRVYTQSTGRYEFIASPWNIGDYETEFNAPADPSKNNDYTPVSVASVTLTGVSLAINQSMNILYEVLPVDANVKTLQWSSSDDTTVSVTQTGSVTGLKGGSAIITAAATDGSGVSGTCTVTVMASSERWELHWDFTTSPAGWTAGDTTPTQPTDEVYGNGMTLLGATGYASSSDLNSIINNDFGSGCQMGIDVNKAGSGFGDTSTPFTKGSVRINRGTFAKIEGLAGPYTITINFVSANGTAVDRYPIVKIGSVSYNNDPAAPGHVPSAGNDPCQLKVGYSGTDSPTVLLKMTGGARVFDVYIEGFRESL
ncbi:hypothetical protein AGMMS49991_03760 [Spirochaetia bacterium]|nr:hypothetical protein AGMMS49991_03760 [Spirochaetia bacterium]